MNLINCIFVENRGKVDSLQILSTDMQLRFYNYSEVQVVCDVKRNEVHSAQLPADTVLLACLSEAVESSLLSKVPSTEQQTLLHSILYRNITVPFH